MKQDSTCVHGARNASHNTGAVAVPIFQTSTFAHPSFGNSTGYDYSRTKNPTREYLEETVANLEKGSGALAFSTGMAAVAVMMELFGTGDHIIASDDLYGGTVRFFDMILKKNGVMVDYVDTNNINEVKNKITAATKAIFVETPTNPMMRVTDIAAVSTVAKQCNALLIVDNTFLTPYFQQPILLGADLVIHSGTKYLGGHNDTLAGLLVCADKKLLDKLSLLAKTIGACLAPFDCFLLIRGIKTLALRMERHEKNAMQVAEWLRGHEKVSSVYYAGLESHPDIEISRRQSTGFGGMISFEVCDEETAKQVLGRVRLIMYAESLGGVESLITYPLTQTHADIPREIRERNGITGRLLRLSVGIEDAGDIICDLEQALAGHDIG